MVVHLSLSLYPSAFTCFMICIVFVGICSILACVCLYVCMHVQCCSKWISTEHCCSVLCITVQCCIEPLHAVQYCSIRLSFVECFSVLVSALRCFPCSALFSWYCVMLFGVLVCAVRYCCVLLIAARGWTVQTNMLL